MPDKLYRDRRGLANKYLDPARPLSGGRGHCCDLMTSAVTHVCDQHSNPFDCPDNLVIYDHAYDEYGLVVHDGGPSSVLLSFCPWCGTSLPASKRDAWFERLEAMGIEHPAFSDVPEPFQSDAWWQPGPTDKRA